MKATMVSEMAVAWSTRVDSVGSAEWSELLGRFDDASVYQSWAYGSIHWGDQQLSHLVLNRGSAVVAMAQMRVVQLPMIRKGVAYIRWGPLCRLKGQTFDPETLRQVVAALKQEYVYRRGLLLRILPPAYEDDCFAAVWKTAALSVGLVKNEKPRPYRTMRVDLALPVEEMRKNLHPRWRNYLKSAEKDGFCVRAGNDIEFYDQFLDAYRQMMARKQFDTTVDVNEFRKIQAHLPEPLRMQIFLCEKRGKLFNALVVAAAGDTGIYLLAATSDEGLNGKGAHLLQWRAMEWMKAKGFRWYELGGINPERNPGVFQFKNGLGGIDSFQIGMFESCASWLSGFSVRAGEGLQASARGFLSRVRQIRFAKRPRRQIRLSE
jgi:GNAT acetyltransferase-like protein